ncbi:hypothetical protein M8756_00100 [Lutimaribacter sp. EGI FJ00015]|uniref:Uncharacterized protein n=1 Tax=Lutimaribacter degradans TaxID=2945989 RepID=A0ACC5ZUX7_9RHOB|nr:hypothetical protein [Lutimaribacter sp. EGI FJ00013]MCM2561354.1 hypothetical protein [Lutimaribacter sp. EGI FJ00013]MCO0611695.1 hypothetical protein [Lutimaribacter sp. EGI FJ00015]MCO0635183.1 hypothetical protein [Lutimaribacter sp. EGI FJ00014]
MSQSKRQARRAWAAARRKHIKRGHVYHVQFHHDPACAIYSQERICCCNPDRILMDDRGRVLARVQGAGFYDPLELVEGAQ